ncbi:MAG: hypothetical protein DRP47_08330 [Candidatus Zixiibacteriota bacterium]|nr:MAG: hypothetical protein DRP47_08330 [candidate division Zixibacteria bacterium]
MNSSFELFARGVIILILTLLCSVSALQAGPIIADHVAVTQFDDIPTDTITAIGSNFNIHYVHTSHGSQIVTGISMVETENPTYNPPPFHEPGDDLGHNGDTSWVPSTRIYLNDHPECNMAMFSWCGGCSDNTEAGINIYLAKMEELEADYPDVTFIYMTGHLDGTGTGGNLYARNNQIRDYCNAHDKILFDFADIESWDPDGNYYPDESDYCHWCYDWCSAHTCPSCGSCAHSHCFNCYLKGKAWWWMMARISGWNISMDVDDEDANNLPDSYRLHQNYPNPFNPTTYVSYDLPRASNVQLTVYNVTGQTVQILTHGWQKAGHHQQEWDGCSFTGNPVASGFYFYRLKAGEFVDTKKMVLLK